MTRLLLACALWIACALLPCAAQPLIVRYPNINGMGERGLGYRMLELALRQSGRDYKIQLQPYDANPQRARALLDVGDVDVIDFGSTPEFERRFTAVYFPIDRGLNGWRLLVIRKEDEGAFARVKTLADLRRFSAGQGLGWPDADILRAAGLQVQAFPNLGSLFRSLEGRRFDYLPLGMDEAHDLTQRYATGRSPLKVLTRIAIVYPFGRLFFVRKGNTALRDLIEAGLRRAFASGQMQKLLADDPGFAQATQQGMPRIRLRIENPALTREFRAIPAEYFIH